MRKEPTAASYRVENHAGRLIEARVWRLSTPEEVDAYAEAIVEKVASCRAPFAPVLCADHRSANIYGPPVADRMAEVFRPNNTRFDRIAILVSPENATLLMQLQRLAREAGSDRRKVFLRSRSALDHLAMSLDPLELERVERFLSMVSS